MTPLIIGYGTGSRTLQGRPSVLRVAEGTNFEQSKTGSSCLKQTSMTCPESPSGNRRKAPWSGCSGCVTTAAPGKKNRPVQILLIITNQQDYPGLDGNPHGGDRYSGSQDSGYSTTGCSSDTTGDAVTVDGEAFDVSVKPQRLTETSWQKNLNMMISKKLHTSWTFL